MKITKPLIFSAYMLASCLLIMAVRFFVPSVAVPLPIFSVPWRLVYGFIDWFYLFPALFCSGIALLFGIQQNPQDNFGQYSRGLLAYLKAPIIIGIVTTLVYAALSLLVAPLAHDFVSTLQLRGELYTQSRADAIKYASQNDWPNAEQFMRICDSIWPESLENEALREQIETGVDSLRLSSSLRDEPAADDLVLRDRHPLGKESVTATDALVMADTAFSEGRYYDSHWLAVLASRLARRGSVEAAQAQRLATLAWDALGVATPSVEEERAYYLYQQKREGYSALLAEDWIRAYYIFKALESQLPSDPDVVNFLALSEAGALQGAFFSDEVDEYVGEMLSGALFSLPIENGGRAVMRVFSLSTLSDASYGTGFELMAFSADGTLRYAVTTPFVKIKPIRHDETDQLLIIFHALSREKEEVSLKPVWSGGERPSLSESELLLDVSYSDFLLLSRLRRGFDALSINDLLTAADHFGDYGYIPKVFEAELLYRLGEPGAMLSLVMVIIIVGWRFRSLKRPRYLEVPMLFILPAVFNGLVFCFRKMLNLLSTTSVITFSFSTAIMLFSVGLVCLFIFCLIQVAAQHG